jgi:hypothetical protein
MSVELAQLETRMVEMEQPRIERAMDLDTYRRIPRLSPSSAKHALESALAYKNAIETAFAPTDDMALGTACHAAVWEPDELPLRVVVWDGGTRRGKAWDDFEYVNREKLIVTKAQWQTVCKVRDRVQSHPAIRSIVSRSGMREASVFWDRETAHGMLACKGRPDFISDRIYDLKTTYQITDRAIERTVVDFYYHMQLAAYRDGNSRVTGEELATVLIFAQTRPPFDARVVVLDGPELARGQELWRDACGIVAACRATGEYPGISETETALVLPDWALGSSDDFELTLDGVAVEM